MLKIRPWSGRKTGKVIKGGQLPSYINWVAGWSGEVKAELRDQKENLLLQGQKILELQNELGYDNFVQKFDAHLEKKFENEHFCQTNFG